MAEMTSVELLRAAAAKVRKRAMGATDGPWLRWTDQERVEGWDGFLVIGDSGPLDGESNPTARVYTEEDAAWMVLVHPGLAEPLAALLDRDATLLRIKGRDYPPDARDALVREYAETFYGDSLRLAQKVLGVPDGR